MYQRIILSFVLSLLCLMSACLPFTTTPPEEPVAIPAARTPEYQFDYVPQAQENPLEAVVAMLNPVYEVKNVSCEPETPAISTILDEYTAALAKDFEETLLAKNYTLIGPFTGIDQMVFGDKERAALALQPIISLTLECQDNKDNVEILNAQRRPTGDVIRVGRNEYPYYRQTGTVKMPGLLRAQVRITLVMTEPLSEQRVWQKDIAIPASSAPYTFYLDTRYTFHLDPQTREIVIEDEVTTLDGLYDERPAVVADVLNGLYQQQLATFSDYFDPREIAIAAEDAVRAKERRRF
jgi:hypothetical protein